MNRQRKMICIGNSCAIATIGGFYFITNLSKLFRIEECEYPATATSTTINVGVNTIVTHGPCYAYGDVWSTILFLVLAVVGVVGGYYTVQEMVDEWKEEDRMMKNE